MRSFLSKLLLCLSLGFSSLNAAPQRIVNVYNWAYVITPEILQQFEKETGIKVNYDVYDSSEVAETKLLAGQSGYDVVGVTVWPYLARQLEANLYQPLNLELIPNRAGLEELLLKRMAEKTDPGNKFALPFLWGTNGFGINRKKILERFPEAPIHSFAMLFDPEVVAKFADCGVMLIDSPVDVFPAMLKYLKKDPNSDSIEDLKLASEALGKLRPYVKKFQPVPTARDLTSGDYCLVEGFSGEMSLAQNLGKESGMDIIYVIPDEGSGMWLDAFAIPIDAHHIPEAHAFINFMLKPEIIAKVTNGFETANSVPASREFIEESIKSNPLIYPSKELQEKLYVDRNYPPKYERLRLREWTRVKIGR
jgi:putrescine transport system substrate-binding protein